LSIGVGSRQLNVDGVNSRSDHPRIGRLAERLHRHQLAAVLFRKGLEEGELAEFLALVSVEAERAERPLGSVPPTALPTWPHIRIDPIRYDRFGLLEHADAPTDRTELGDVWLELGRAALLVDPDGDGETPDAPAVGTAAEIEHLAAAIEQSSASVGKATAVMDQLVPMAHRLSESRGAEAERLRDQTSRLVGAVKPAALDRLLELGSDAALRRQLVVDTVPWLEPEPAVKLLQSAARVEGVEISNWLLLILTKLAEHGRSESTGLRQEAASRLCTQVEQLVAGWEQRDENPPEYVEALQRLAKGDGAEAVDALEDAPEGLPASQHSSGSLDGYPPGEDDFVIPPEHLVLVSLEIDEDGPEVQRALDAMLRDDFDGLLRILDSAPTDSTVADTVWRRVETADPVGRLIALPDADIETLGIILSRLGNRAAQQLIQVLLGATSRHVRSLMYQGLARLGPDAAREVIRHLTDDRWFVRRNMLAVLGEYDTWPSEFNPAAFADDNHAFVRREALKLMLLMERSRESAILRLLEDDEPRNLALGLAAVYETPTPTAIALLVDRATDQDLQTKLRIRAIRALGVQNDELATQTLLQLCGMRSGVVTLLLRRPRFDNTRLTIAALAALRDRDLRDRRVRRVLKRAVASEIPEVRAAAWGGWR